MLQEERLEGALHAQRHGTTRQQVSAVVRKNKRNGLRNPLAQMGADVIHVEPHEGDDGRNSSTRFLGKEGTTYSVGNRSKRDITVDIRTAEGQAVMHRLLKDADIFSFRFQ